MTERQELTSVNMPVPIRPDFIAQVLVPWDLTKAEAAKICRVVAALVRTDGVSEDSK